MNVPTSGGPRQEGGNLDKARPFAKLKLARKARPAGMVELVDTPS